MTIRPPDPPEDGREQQERQQERECLPDQAQPRSREDAADLPPGDGGAGSADGGAGSADGGETAEEAALRRLLRESVRDIEPSSDALGALQRAVPARRRQRRRLVTAATTVAVLAVGTPVTLHAASTNDTGNHPVEAGHNQEADGSTGMDGTSGDGPGTHATGGPQQPPGERGEESGPGTTEPTPEDGDAPGSTDPEDEDQLAGSYPRCARDQLGAADATVEPADAEGLIYGVIQVSNVSDEPCRVRGTDELRVSPISASDTTRAAVPQVIARTEGDRATALPLSDQWRDELVLLPGEAYEVHFAWVPKRGLDKGGCAVPPDTDPPPGDGSGSPSSGPGSGSGGDAPGEVEQSDQPADDGTGGNGGSDGGSSPGGSGGGDGDSDGSGDPGDAGQDGMVVRYTPAAGPPSATTVTLPGVCSGSVYRTGVLEVPEGGS